MRRVIVSLIAAMVTAVAVAGTAGAIPEQGTPEFDAYMEGLQRNGFNLNPDTAWRVAHQACEGGIPGFIGWEMIAQGVISGGMLPKLAGVRDALAHGVEAAQIVDGRIPHSVLIEIFTEAGIGTKITA